MSHDTELQRAVMAELNWEPSVSAAHIGVTAKGGVVTLSGHVESFVERHAAEDAASRVKGVKGVAEEIEVRLPFDIKRSDDEIAAAALNRLAWNASLPKDAIKVKVEKGIVTLTGHVDWHYQLVSAEADVRNLFGVVALFNEVKVKSKVDTANLSDSISTALHRNWFFDPKTVKVSAEGGSVKLTGTVHSWHDRDVAGTTAWSAPGATWVDNQITVV
jgi:osmotically-inducible protein OsmY